MKDQAIPLLGGLTAEAFLAEYWQKKPLLVRNAMPEIVGLKEQDLDGKWVGAKLYPRRWEEVLDVFYFILTSTSLS